MKDFQQRLKDVLQGGNLTVADLARWVDRPDPSVRGWVVNGGEPGGGPLDKQEIQFLLEKLERLVQRNRSLPLPRLSPQERIRRLKKLRSALG